MRGARCGRRFVRMEKRSPPISRVLLRRADSARYDRHSSRPAVADGLEPPTRGLGEQRRRPPIWCCSGWRLPRFTRFPLTEATRLCGPVPRLRSAALSGGYCGRALPGIPLCGARTFLSPGSAPEAATIWRASQRHYRRAISRATGRSAILPAQLSRRRAAARSSRRRTRSSSGTRHGSRTSVTVSPLRGRP